MIAPSIMVTLLTAMSLEATRDKIETCAVPASALLGRYVGEHAYTDCYRVEVCATVTQAQFVYAFYTTRVFKLERAILKWAVAKASDDAGAGQLARGEIDRFSAWHVEQRSENQLLLADYRGRTRSWLMSVPTGDENSATTELYFGSAVVPNTNPAMGEARLGLVFRLLLRFHKIYSRILLHAAKSQLQRQAR